MGQGTSPRGAGQDATAGLSLEDAELLAEAHHELLSAQAAGVPVVGSTAGGELVDAAYAVLRAPAVVDETAARDAVLDEFEARLERRMAAALVNAAALSLRDQVDELGTRRERRAAARALRGAA